MEILGLIKRKFTDVSKDCFILLCKSLVRSHLYHANSICHTRRKIDIERYRKYKNNNKINPWFSKTEL